MALFHSDTKGPQRQPSGRMAGRLPIAAVRALSSPVPATAARGPDGAARHTEIRRRMRALAIAVRDSHPGSQSRD